MSKQRFIFPILCFIILKLDFSDLFRRFSRKTHQFELLIFQPKILNFRLKYLSLIPKGCKYFSEYFVKRKIFYTFVGEIKKTLQR